MADEALMQTM